MVYDGLPIQYGGSFQFATLNNQGLMVIYGDLMGCNENLPPGYLT